MKTLRRYTFGLFVHRDLSLSAIHWQGVPKWNLCRSGSDKKLPCGKESVMFSTLQAANEYLNRYGFNVAGQRSETDQPVASGNPDSVQSGKGS